jgi:hypothetical protein
MIRSYTDHAANERTFLAWIRTGLVIMALGFVMERLDLLLASLRLVAQGREVPTMGAGRDPWPERGLGGPWHGIDRGLELPVRRHQSCNR